MGMKASEPALIQELSLDRDALIARLSFAITTAQGSVRLSIQTAKALQLAMQRSKS